jgi:tellurite resistance protein TerC
VLFWGILGALVLRGIMIAAGTALLARFEWILYVFGALLLFTAFRLMFSKEEKMNPDKNWLVVLARKIYPVAHGYHSTRFFTHVNGKRAMTILFLVLLVVESSDVLFAVDSIPAVIAVTRDPFLVFTSNVFAILGLRSLYFALSGLVQTFKYLKSSLVVLLAFIGVKMLIEHWYSIPVLTSFLVIVGLLTLGIGASLISAWRQGTPLTVLEKDEEPAPEGELPEDYAWRQARKMGGLIMGSSSLLIIVGLLVLPGAFPWAIIGGAFLLGLEFLWARRVVRRHKSVLVCACGHNRGK